MSLRRDLLALPAAEGARVVALELLEAATSACERISDPNDEEALHDLRVALRRLRSCLRAYRAFLEDSISRKLERRVRDLANATDVARDTEVHLAWLAERRPTLGPRHRPGADWFREWLERRHRDAYEAIREEVATTFSRLQRKLGRRLRYYTAEVGGERSPARLFAGASARLLREHNDALLGELSHITSAVDEVPAHDARIAAKRLRYLLEPLRTEVEGGAATVGKLKSLQDLLGELHDRAVLGEHLQAGLTEASADRARLQHRLAMATPEGAEAEGTALRRDARPGLLALAKLVREERDHLFSKLGEEWLGEGAAAFGEGIGGLADRLVAALEGPSPRPRKFA